MILINTSPKDPKKAQRDPSARKRRLPVRQIVPVAMILVIVGGGIFYRVQGSSASSEQVVVYNWGEYLDCLLYTSRCV